MADTIKEIKIIQMMEKNSDNTYNALYPAAAQTATIVANCEAGATIVCVSNTGKTNQSYTLGNDETYHNFTVYEIGATYTLTASKGEYVDVSTTVEVKTDTSYEITLTFFKAYIAVTSKAGATVTVTGKGESESYTYGSSETSHTFFAKQTGTYSITAVKSGNTTATGSVTVSSSTTYSVSVIPFDAYITVTSNKGGSVMTVTSGSNTQTYTCGSSETSHTFTVNKSGTYSVKVTKSGYSAQSSTVSVTSETTYSKSFTFFIAYIKVTSISGAYVTVGSQSYTYGSSETTHTFTITTSGTYTIKATKSGYNDASTTQSVTSETTYNVTVTPRVSINNKTWSEIRAITDAGTQASYFAVGDVKMETISGTIGDTSFNGSYGFVILDLEHRASSEGSGIVFGGFKTAVSSGKDIAFCASNYGDSGQTTGFIMNQSNITTGGWNGSYMKQTIMPQMLNAVTSDLQNNIRTSTIWTHNTTGGSGNDSASNVTSSTEKFYLLAEYEIFGSRNFANSYEKNSQAQMTYYKNGNSKVKYKHSSTSSSVYWWERSPDCHYSFTSYFCSVYSGGFATCYDAAGSVGFAPCFRL